MRVSGHPESNGLAHIHTDHLGSMSVLTWYGSGYIRGDSRVYYYPFGDYRLQPTSEMTDRRFTGQRENMDWGLYYYNARYYVPYIYRMLTPDSIAPDFKNPQNLNRYAYVRNNPVKYRDPSGHALECGAVGGDCSDGLTPSERLKMLEESGQLDNPDRTETIEIPVAVNGKLAIKIVIPPVNAMQSSIGPSPRRGIGRVMAATGIAIDAVEVALAVSPGGGVLPGFGDAVITYLSGMLTGDNYGPWAPPPAEIRLPSNMISINQDAIWNGVEAAIPPVAAGTLGISSASLAAATVATPFPGDEELAAVGLAPASVFAYQLIDVTSSGASMLYDFGRFAGYFNNNLTLGYSPGSGYKLHMIYWPHE